MTDKAPDKFDYAGRDRHYWNTINKIVQDKKIPLENVLRHWSSFIMRRDLPRFLSHYELFKHVVDLPGCILEIGVYRGDSLFTWSMLMETFCPFDRSRRVIGFDSFQGLTQFTEQDGGSVPSLQGQSGIVWEPDYIANPDDMQQLVDIHNWDNMMPGTGRLQIKVGNVQDTLPLFLEENPGLKISLLHMDVDLYEPTKYAFEKLYPLVVQGGVVCFDEYGLVPWQGETRAVDEYFAEHGNPPVIRKFPFAQTPHGYFIK